MNGPMNPARYMRRVRATDRRDIPGLSSIGRSTQYGQSDPNAFPRDGSYNEQVTFNGAEVALEGPLAGSGAIAKSMGTPTGYQQNDHFVVSVLSVYDGSRRALPYNPKRIALTVQNQDPALDLYFSLGAQAISGGQFVGVKLVAGQGYTFDNGCVPCDELYVAWSAAGGVGIVMEGTRL